MNSSLAYVDAPTVSAPREQAELQWYAVYTCARHEKRVAQQLTERRVESYLPLYEALHRWKDRRARVQLPLFPGYVFVRIALRDRLKVLEVPSVVRLVSVNGRPTPLPENEMTSLRNGLSNDLRAEPHPYLKIGRRVRVHRGPLVGREGILVRKKDKLRLVLSIDLIMRSVAVEVDAADIEPVR
jgi:transcription antitermination factor NusG